MTAAEFNPMATRAIETAEFPKDHNQPANDNEPTPFDLIKQEIEDLFEEASNFCDGEAIADEATAAAITELHDRIHAAGKRADDMRVEEKAPLDEKVKALQAKYAPLISDTKAVKGKVVLGKEACQTLLTPWRTRIAAEKAAEAALAAERAAEATRIAQEAIRASSGNLAARVEAEELLAHAATVTKQAARADKAATTGTGLRTVWRAELVDIEAGLEWFYGERPEEFTALVQRLADEAVHRGVRKVPGFNVVEEKKAMTGMAK